MKRAAQLILNPFASLAELQDSPNLAIQIHAPVKSQRIKLYTNIDPKADQKEYEVLSQWIEKGFPKRINLEKCPLRLVETGLFVTKKAIPKKVKYNCSLGDVKLQMTEWLLTDRFVRLSKENPKNLQINPSLRFEKNSRRIWVKDPFTECRFPLDLTSAEIKRVKQLRTRPSQILNLKPPTLQLMLLSRIITPKINQKIKQMMKQEINAFAENMKLKRHTKIPQLLTLPQIIHLQKYYKAMIEEGFAYSQKTTYITRSCFFKDDVVGRQCIEGYLKLFKKVYKPNIKAGIFYLLEYQPGEELKIHTDAPESSELSVSVQLYYKAQNVSSENKWSIFMQSNQGAGMNEVRLDNGDAIAFAGQELLHYRDKLPENEKSGVILFSFHDIAYKGEVN